MHMDRAIFDLKVSVEATSAYILICSLLDGGHHPDLDKIRSLWNGSEQSLQAAISELMERQVLQNCSELSSDTAVAANPADKWRWNLHKILQQD
jgi:hypothetical protein